MEISFNTPALLFPAITLLMLAYTNRFLAIANLIRNLHSKYNATMQNLLIESQIKNLRKRLKLIKYMQFMGVFSFLLCVLSMLFFYSGHSTAASALFGLSLLALLCSLLLSLYEIQISTQALELELSDMQNDHS
ncbi:MAG: DUF2721 domain-containing protein [Bacteroidia bacterium]|jgi:uncharacterized membrane protein|nr:DUF2721 domain-containing protein [Bacteroidia bacterium]